jgi:hypothetical protein
LSQIAETTAARKEPSRIPLIGVTWRAALVAVAFTVICSYWIDQTEVVTFFCQITESVPAIPAVAILVLLVVFNPFARRLSKRLALDRREMIAIYIFVAIATSMAGCGIARFWINTIPALHYFAQPDNEYRAFQQYFPKWWIPQDPEILRQLYEGSPTGAIPWRPWAVPLVGWGAIYMAIWVALMGIAAMFHRQWADRERLTYPLLYLPMEMTEGVERRDLVGEFFRNRLMWIGFTIAFIYNVTNIVNAYNPGIPAVGKFYDFGRFLTERPWTALQPMTLHYRPEMIGFGYLVSTEVALSVWLLYMLLRIENLVPVIMGYDVPGMPFAQEQGIGAYIALGLVVIWVARGHLKIVLRKAWRPREGPDDRGEAMSYRGAVLAAAGGFAATVMWASVAGMAPWLGIAYFGLVLLVALVYSRMRAEVGVPLIWMFPFFQHHKLFKYALGPKFLHAHGGYQSLTVFGTLIFFSRGYFPSLQGYQIEGYRMGDHTGLNLRSLSRFMIGAVAVGFFVAAWLHLRSYYEYGAGGLRALEGWGAGLAKVEFTELTSYPKGFPPVDTARTVATGVGFGFAAALFAVRTVFLRFPLHPLAWGMVTAYGDLIWGSFFIVWLVKAAVFKLGGMRTYRLLIPLFIGLALGHFFTAGILYGLIGAYGPESFQRYGVWFG